MRYVLLPALPALRTTLYDRPGEAVDGSQETRTSSGTFLAAGMDPEGVLGWVEQRIAAATLLPAENGEVGAGRRGGNWAGRGSLWAL